MQFNLKNKILLRHRLLNIFQIKKYYGMTTHYSYIYTLYSKVDNLRKSNFLNPRLPFFVPRHLVVMHHFIDISQRLNKFLVVGDDDEHKVLLCHSLLNYLPKSRT